MALFNLAGQGEVLKMEQDQGSYWSFIDQQQQEDFCNTYMHNGQIHHLMTSQESYDTLQCISVHVEKDEEKTGNFHFIHTLLL